MKKIRIINLGEIVTPDFAKGFVALAQIIARKKSIDYKDVLPDIQSVVQENMDAIEKFKQGILTEQEFDRALIAAIQKKTEVELTVDEFNKAWAAMNPPYAIFGQTLKMALDFHKEKNQQLIFMSYTNPKDMRQLTQGLQSNDVPCKVDARGNLCEIDGVRLYSTYVARSTKPGLLEQIIGGLNRRAPHGLFSESKNDFQSNDIKYIYGVNKIRFEALKKEFDKTASSVQKTAEAFQVETILWNKEEMSLQAVLNQEKPVQGLVLAAML